MPLPSHLSPSVIHPDKAAVNIFIYSPFQNVEVSKGWLIFWDWVGHRNFLCFKNLSSGVFWGEESNGGLNFALSPLKTGFWTGSKKFMSDFRPKSGTNRCVFTSWAKKSKRVPSYLLNEQNYGHLKIRCPFERTIFYQSRFLNEGQMGRKGKF